MLSLRRARHTRLRATPEHVMDVIYQKLTCVAIRARNMRVGCVRYKIVLHMLVHT
jgi:hypothetical protein